MYIYKDEMQTYGHMERRRDQKADDFKTSKKHENTIVYMNWTHVPTKD